MSRVKKILLGIVVAVVLFWAVSIARCEYLTLMYGQEFKSAYEEIRQIIAPSKWKVLDFSESSSKVYFYSDKGGVVVTLIYKNEKWTIDKWTASWSKTGSADDLIWPYFR